MNKQKLKLSNFAIFFQLDTQIGKQKLFRQIINIYVYIPVIHIIPILTLIIINILTVRRLIDYHNEHSRLLSQSIRRKSLVNESQRHHHGTFMLIAIMVLFVICRIPMLINQLCELQHLTNYHLCFPCRTQRIFSTCANFMQTINSNGNLIIYLTFCRNFRDVSKEIIQKYLDLLRFLRPNQSLFSGRSRASTHSTDT